MMPSWSSLCPLQKTPSLKANVAFQVEASPLCFTAEGKLLSAHVYVSDGILQVPDELRYITAANMLQLLSKCMPHILPCVDPDCY